MPPKMASTITGKASPKNSDGKLRSIRLVSKATTSKNMGLLPGQVQIGVLKRRVERSDRGTVVLGEDRIDLRPQSWVVELDEQTFAGRGELHPGDGFERLAHVAVVT